MSASDVGQLRSGGGVFQPANMNLYGYVQQRPVVAVDPNGEEIRLQTNDVALGAEHAYLIVIPENQTKYRESDSRFLCCTSDGRVYATVGAGPASMRAGDPLTSGINRKNDADVSLKLQSDQPIVHPDILGGTKTEDEIINEIFDAEVNFDNGEKLEYHLYPERTASKIKNSSDQGYNSNSFVSGLLQAIGFRDYQVPAPRGGNSTNVPGWITPVPSEHYE